MTGKATSWNTSITPETGHEKTGDSAKKSLKNYLGIQGFELSGKDEKVWTNNIGEMKGQRRLNRSQLDYYWKGSLQWERFVELVPNKATWGHKHQLFKKSNLYWL